MPIRRLTFKAPSRCWDQGASRQWTLRDVILYIFEAGGWFAQGSHNFADPIAAQVALDPRTYREVDYQ